MLRLCTVTAAMWLLSGPIKVAHLMCLSEFENIGANGLSCLHRSCTTTAGNSASHSSHASTPCGALYKSSEQPDER